MLFTVVIVLSLAAIGVLAGYRMLDKRYSAIGNRACKKDETPSSAQIWEDNSIFHRVIGELTVRRIPRSRLVP